jgi:DNA-binding transcriptional LysR family regulator
MELRHIQRFIAVAEELHFGRAAQRLGISQPPLSQQIQALEAEIGAKLFERTKREVRLTKAGEAMLVEAYRLVDQGERVKRAARRASAGEIGRLTLGCVTSAFYQILPPILDRFRAKYPEVGLSLREVDTADAVPDLQAGRLDFGFIRLDAVEEPLKMLPLRRDAFVAALPEKHALARRRKLALKDLAQEDFVIFARRVSPRFYDSIVNACLSAGFSPSIAHESTSILSQVGFVACGLAVALVPRSVKHLHMPGVTFRELDQTIPLTDIALVWRSAPVSELAQRFIDVAERAFPQPVG